MEILKAYIDKQLEINRSKNLLFENLSHSMSFIPIDAQVWHAFKEMDEASQILLLDYLTDKVIQSFCQVNQYYSIDEKATRELRLIYSSLFQKLKQIDSLPETDFPQIILDAHFRNLRKWLKHTNQFAQSIYPPDKEVVERVTCAQYSASLQIDLFKIDILRMEPPVLDIGCGKEGHLVSFLREKGVQAFGIDRFELAKPFLEKSDWLEYDYGINKWGTIISHLGFSNHFKHHHQRIDGNYLGYAKTYMRILHSLKCTGAFYYAPNLPFIEHYLEEDRYQVEIVDIDSLAYKAAKITKLR